MRSELHEAATHFTPARADASRAPEALAPSAVDAALGDEAAPMDAPRGPRREIAAAAPGESRLAVDVPHDGALLRQLSRQLSLLEIQQQQIRRLLEQTERRAGRA